MASHVTTVRENVTSRACVDHEKCARLAQEGEQEKRKTPRISLLFRQVHPQTGRGN